MLDFHLLWTNISTPSYIYYRETHAHMHEEKYSWDWKTEDNLNDHYQESMHICMMEYLTAGKMNELDHIFQTHWI